MGRDFFILPVMEILHDIVYGFFSFIIGFTGAFIGYGGPVFSIVLVLKILLMGIKKDKGFFFYVVPFVISYGSSSVIAEAFKGFLKLTMKQEVSLICSIAIPLFIILESMLTMAINTEKDEKENKDIDKN